MLRLAFLFVSLSMLAGGAFAARSALDMQQTAYVHPAATNGVLMVVGSPEELLDR